MSCYFYPFPSSKIFYIQGVTSAMDGVDGKTAIDGRVASSGVPIYSVVTTMSHMCVTPPARGIRGYNIHGPRTLNASGGGVDGTAVK